MSMHPNDGAPVFRAKRLKRKNMTFAGDVFIDGDFQSNGRVFIGGNLTVGGSCTMNELICLGDITVGGSLFFCEGNIRGTIKCKGDVSGYGLWMKTDPVDVYHWESATTAEQALLSLAIARSERWGNDGSFDVDIGLDVGGALEIDHFEIWGGARIGGDAVDVDGTINGWFECDGIVGGEYLFVAGPAQIRGRLYIASELYATDLKCAQSCHAGSIFIDSGDIEVNHALVSDSDIQAGGHIKCGNRIQARGSLTAGKSLQSAASIFAPKGVQAGSSYGIYAGLDVPKELLYQHGYIACRVKPPNIKSGVHTKGKHFKDLSDAQKICWPAHDGSDVVS